LVVEYNNYHVSVNVLALVCIILKYLFSSFEVFKSRLGLLVLQMLDTLVINFIEDVLQLVDAILAACFVFIILVFALIFAA
jgi:hypothetical protein